MGDKSKKWIRSINRRISKTFGTHEGRYPWFVPFNNRNLPLPSLAETAELAKLMKRLLHIHIKSCPHRNNAKLGRRPPMTDEEEREWTFLKQAEFITGVQALVSKARSFRPEFAATASYIIATMEKGGLIRPKESLGSERRRRAAGRDRAVFLAGFLLSACLTELLAARDRRDKSRYAIAYNKRVQSLRASHSQRFAPKAQRVRDAWISGYVAFVQARGGNTFGALSAADRKAMTAGEYTDNRQVRNMRSEGDWLTAAQRRLESVVPK